MGSGGEARSNTISGRSCDLLRLANHANQRGILLQQSVLDDWIVAADIKGGAIFRSRESHEERLGPKNSSGG
jgi:hypothetical protein